jgi:CRISPR/Cas system-associated exonuclease Cas4 (RecB family)
MRNFTWSYSGISLFKQCPRKFHRTRILKDVEEEEQDFLLYGKAVHTAAEEYGRDNKKLPVKYEFIKPYVDTLLRTKGDKYYELKMALTADMEPCDFLDPEAWWRGIADFIAVNDGTALLVDYKTGKSARYADTKQLEILSLALFKHFPKVNTVKGGLMFVVADKFIESKFYREREEEYWESWDKDVALLNLCFESGTWNPKSNFSCYKFCPVLDCEHNGRG